MLYAFTIFCSAFLLFLLQPVIARLILPWFGGSAAVWTTCMVFFQAMLLAGYGYAHWATTHWTARRQLLVHTALLLASLLALPIVPGAQWKPAGGDNAIVQILLLLCASVGLPYFMLSTTSPLVQAWFARRHPGKSPYRLFALSNLASMLALLGYPIAVEPWLPGSMQASLWSFAYAGFVLLCAVLAWMSLRDAVPAIDAARTSDGPRPARLDYFVWTALAALGSAALFGVSNHLTQNIPSIPLLWVLPLALYLLTFILCFDGRGWYRRRAFLAFNAVMLGVMAWFIADQRLQFALLWQTAVFSAGLFVVCMFCHGELNRLRPAPAHLTGFYLMVSLGGVIGGALVGIGAPLLLPAYLELPITLALLAAMAGYCYRDMGKPVLSLFMVLVALTLGAVGYRIHILMEDTIAITRNFYGVLRVKETIEPGSDYSPDRSLIHGAILHGEQYQSEKWRRTPTTYYKADSGIGLLLQALSGQPVRIGVIGLGAGTLAAYGKNGDVYRFYDINPEVPRLARKYFTYLQDSAARIEIALGDARLSLEREPTQQFNVLVVDAFSGDSIPIHLITREAVKLYRRHIRPDGVIAFHVSNRFLDLKPVLLRLAERENLNIAYVRNDGDEEGVVDDTSSDWVLLSANDDLLELPEIAEKTEKIEPSAKWPLWTDDYSNMLQVLRIPGRE